MASLNTDTADRLLFEGIKSDDEAALEILFKKYFSKLCFKALTIVKEDTVAEEIVSDIFFKIWNRRDTINIKSNVFLYLCYSVRNHSLNYLKSCKFCELDLSHIEFQAQTSDLSALEHLVMNERIDEWENRINRLPPQRQRIFRMCKLEGLSVNQVADQLSLATQTVRNQMQIAIKGLRESE